MFFFIEKEHFHILPKQTCQLNGMKTVLNNFID